ncbi:MAG: DUF367 family protein [Thermoplasmata archaeon]
MIAPLYVVDFKMDSPKKCTAKKMVSLGIAKNISIYNKKILNTAIVLWPFAETILSPNDAGRGETKGIVVIDTSWVFLERGYEKHYNFRYARNLPTLIAANSVSYGKVGRLSSAEAMAAALYIIGNKNKAMEILNKFQWGETFLSINYEYLEQYAKKR